MGPDWLWSKLLPGVLVLALGVTLGAGVALTSGPVATADASGAASAATSETGGDTGDTGDTGDAGDPGGTDGLRRRLEAATVRNAELRAAARSDREELEAAQARVAALRQQVRDLGPDAVEEVATGADGETSLAVSGTLTSAWVLGPASRPWPEDCSAARGSYRVVVADDEGQVVATADLTASEQTGRAVANRVLTQTCASTWTADLPLPLASDYEFRAVSRDAVDVAIDAATASGTSLDGGSAPDLALSFCPECPAAD